MNLYKYGEYVEKFTGSREWERLVNFIEGHREKISDGEHVESVNEAADPQVVHPESAKTEENRHQEHRPASSRNKDGLVVSLNPSNFLEVLNEGPVFIKFFAPWYAIPIVRSSLIAF
jgi:hypothetical protein